MQRLERGQSPPVPSYCLRCRMLGLLEIKSRHLHAQSSFIASLLTSNIDAPSLLSSIPIHVPSRRLRDRPPICIPSHRSVLVIKNHFGELALLRMVIIISFFREVIIITITL